MPTDPLTTISGINAAVSKDPSLANDSNLIKTYQSLGGTLANYAIPTTPNAPKPVITSPAGVISSQQGVSTINQKTNTLSSLTASNPTAVTPPATPAVTAQPGTSTPTSSTNASATPNNVTFLKADTGQEYTVTNPTADDVTRLQNQGWSLFKGQGPAATVSTTTDSPAMTKAQSDADQAASDLKTLSSNLTKYTVSDADLANQIAGITSQWNAREADMQKINDARKANINTTGIRLGSQYAGGSGGVFGGIVSEEERQGVSRIADLEGQKQAAISAAKVAAQSQNWQVYSKQVDLAQKAYADKVQALQDLQKATADQNKIIADQLKANTEAKAKVDAEVSKNINDVLTSARKNGAPSDVINAISQSADVASAVKAAGDYGTEGSGTVGEYYAYIRNEKALGRTPVDFNTYQTMDANRKANAAASASGLSQGTLSKITTISDQFKTEKTAQDYQTLSQALQQFKNFGTDSSSDDIARIYTFVKAMDPSSSVREGEYSTVQDYAQAYLAKLGFMLKNTVTNSGFLTQDARNKMAQTLDNKLAPLQNSYDKLRGSYANKINKVAGIKDGSDYIIDYSQPSTGDTLSQQETKAENTLRDFISANPDKKDTINAQISAAEKAAGRPLTSQEFLQAFPEYAH